MSGAGVHAARYPDQALESLMPVHVWELRGGSSRRFLLDVDERVARWRPEALSVGRPEFRSEMDPADSTRIWPKFGAADRRGALK